MPLLMAFVLGLIALGIALCTNSLIATDPMIRADEMAGGVGIIFCGIILLPMPYFAYRIDMRIEHPVDHTWLPLVCSCGRDTQQAYAFPEFVWFGPSAYLTGIVLSIAGYILVRNVEVLYIAGAVLALAAISWLFGFVDFVIRHHSVGCSMRRGLAELSYFILLNSATSRYLYANKD